MGEIGKTLIFLGALLLGLGLLMVLGGKLHLPLGRMPGDLVYRGKNTTFYFPIVTCIVLSIVLSIVMWAWGKFGK